MAIQAERPRRLFVTRLGDRAVVSPQNPVVIRPRSEPQPDLLLLRPRAVSYSREHPNMEDVLLAVEVADTTVRFDRRWSRRSPSPTSGSPWRTSSPEAPDGRARRRAAAGAEAPNWLPVVDTFRTFCLAPPS